MVLHPQPRRLTQGHVDLGTALRVRDPERVTDLRVLYVVAVKLRWVAKPHEGRVKGTRSEVERPQRDVTTDKRAPRGGVKGQN